MSLACKWTFQTDALKDIKEGLAGIYYAAETVGIFVPSIDVGKGQTCFLF